MTKINNVLFSLFAFYGFIDAFDGDLTFYGGAGKGGSCTSDYIPSGFTTVAMNSPQYKAGAACGACISASYIENGKTKAFNAIVDNKCPECKEGDLDLGQNGSGRFPLIWNFIECPKAELKFSTQGSNSFYCKLKIERGGVIKNVLVNNKQATLTDDGYWVLSDSTGSLGCGPKVLITLENHTKVTKCLDGALFGSSCKSNKKCTLSNEPQTTPKSPSPTSTNNRPTLKPSSNTNSSTSKPTKSNTNNNHICISPGGSKCENGLLHYNKKACCPITCKQCGGSQCAKYKGGLPNCCNSGIVKYNNRSCLTNPPPCLID